MSGRHQRDYLVSALVPIYNAGRFIRGLLEDLQAQTLADQIEIVICDTASPQNERAVIEEFMARYDNIVYLRTEHRENSHAALNRCIQAASGRYLTLACVDDRHRSDALEVMARAVDAHPEVGLVYADSLITKRANETFACNTAHSLFRWPEYSLRQLLMYNFFGPQPMWRASLHRECGIFDPDLLICGDYDLFFRLARKAGAHHISERLGLFLEGGNATQNQAQCVRETQALLGRYRSEVPLEEIYPLLRGRMGDSKARAAVLIDFGNAVLSSACPDHLLTRRLYRQAQQLLGNDPAILNNLGVIECLLGCREQGISLLRPLIAVGHEAARANLNALMSNDPAQRARFQLGALSDPVLDDLPPLVPPQQTQQPWINPAAVSQPQSDRSLRSAGATPRAKGISFVVITAGRRPELLSLVIHSIRRQNIPQYEILVIGRHHEEPGLRYLPAEGAARDCRRGAMRNIGMRAARFDQIVFLDDDCLLSLDWYPTFLAGPQDFDILTMRMRLPDGSRYWDHVKTAGEGKQKLLLDDEADPFVYATSGAMVIRDYVADAVCWDEIMEVGEDVEFSRQCQAQGYSITHSPHCAVFHADATYTSIGRWTLRRKEGRTHEWVQSALEGLSAEEIYTLGTVHLGHDNTAESVDCFRYGLLRYPEYTPFALALAGIEALSGGHLPGVNWFPHSDPDYLTVLRDYEGREGEKGRRGEGEGTPSHCLRLDPRIPRQDLNVLAEPSPVGAYQLPLSTLDLAGEAEGMLSALERCGVTLSARLYRTGPKVARLPISQQARLLAYSQVDHRAAADIRLTYLPTAAVQRREDTTVLIGRVSFDAERPSSGWVEACNQLDAVWVPSAFHRDACERAGVRPELLRVIPTPLVTAHFRPDVKPLPIHGARSFNFLALCEWSFLSGWDVLLRAFVQEFTAADDLALILRPQGLRGMSAQRLQQQVVNCIQQALRGDTSRMPTIVLHTEDVPLENMPNLYRAADCFVRAGRGAGSSRSCLEAMAMGMPVIATRWGAQVDYLTERNSFPVEAQVIPVPEAGQREAPLLRGLRWAEPSIAHLRQQMREAYMQRERVREIGQQGRAEILERHDYTQVAQLIATELARLQARVPDNLASPPSVCVEVLL